MLPIAPPRKYNDKILIVTALPIDEPSIADPPPAVPAPPAAAAEAAVPVEAAPAAESPRAAAAVPMINSFLFELEFPAAAVIQQLSSQPAGPGCCSSGGKILYRDVLECTLYGI